MSYQIIEIDTDIESSIIFKIKQLNNKNLEPILELYKGKVYCYLVKDFINNCINILGNHIFTIKKSFSRTITNLLSSWIFSLYIDYDFSSDYFLPTNYNNTTFLENTLFDLCKYDLTIKDSKEKINKIIFNLKTNYKNQLELLNDYEKSLIFNNNKSNYKIKKNINKKNNSLDKEIDFYKFEIYVPFIIKDKRLQNTLNNILMPVKNYNKLLERYNGPKNKIDEYIWAIIFRYQLLGSNNQQLAVLPNIMNSMKEQYNLNFECFASAINSTFNNYCSIYYDLEKYFGSVGSFFNMIPIKGTYEFNPPYQKDIIDLGINKILNYLENTTEILSFIITIPIWDLDGKKYMKDIYNNELEKQNIDYGEFPIINSIKTSKFLKGLRMIPKEQFTYVDHNFELYKNKTIQNTYVIILSTENIDLSNFNNYNFESFET